MKLKHFQDLDSDQMNEINELSLEHLGKDITTKNSKTDVFAYVDEIDEIYEIKGYAILDSNKIDWIYAVQGYGTPFLKDLEKHIFKSHKKVVLNVSVDPTEDKTTVIRRLNFYIKNDYRIYDIEFRKKNGPLFKMHKISRPI